MNIHDYDASLDDAMFKTKVDNIFVMLHTSIMQGDIDRVKHKLTDELYNHYKKIVDDLNNSNKRQMYDELNVKSTSIDNILKDKKEIKVYVTIISRYMDYIVNKENFSLLSGNNSSRVEKTNKLIFVKQNDASELGAVRRCTSCGAPADISSTGKCEYCGETFNTAKYDYVLSSIETF